MCRHPISTGSTNWTARSTKGSTRLRRPMVHDTHLGFPVGADRPRWERPAAGRQHGRGLDRTQGSGGCICAFMQEVDHRAKNALAVVQSIVILSRAENSADFAEVVQGRVAAIARAHTLLASTRWSGADLATMVQQELEAHSAPGQTTISGIPVTIEASSAQAVSIVLHELTINALKYGALSVRKGRIKVTFAVGQRNGGLILDWEESGGPAVTKPTRHGFGSLIIERTVKDQLSGEVDYYWHPAGLRSAWYCPATIS